MKRVLMVASVVSMIESFNRGNIRALQAMGFEVDVATNFECGSMYSAEKIARIQDELRREGVTLFQIDFERDVKRVSAHLRSFQQLTEVMSNTRYQFVHCHSPIGGAIGRLVAKRTGTPCLYTAHGFHFFKGSSLLSWIFYYPIERMLAHLTDTIVTVNHEDFVRAKTFKSPHTVRIHGIGVDTQQIERTTVDRYELRHSIGMKQDTDYVLLSVGELNVNKNQETIIRALAALKDSRIHYWIVGSGEHQAHLERVAATLGLSEHVHFLGFREDVIEVMKAADCFVFPSRREGLGMAALEAMAAGLPLITSNIHGINDYSVDGVTGYKCAPNDVLGFARAIRAMQVQPDVSRRMGAHNLEWVKAFDIIRSQSEMGQIYAEFV